MIDFGTLEQQYGLEPGLLSAVSQRESNGDPNAVGAKGEQGLFQFMPSTAKQYGIDPTDPDQSAIGAARMLSDLKQQFGGDTASALAAYNWGSGNMEKHGIENAPASTKSYVSDILGKIGNAIVPSANAAEADNQQVFENADKADVLPTNMKGSTPAPQGRDLSGELFSSPQPTDSGRDLSGELFSQEQPQQSALLPTGPKQIIPETETQAKSALDLGASGAKDVGKALSPLVSLAKMAVGKPLTSDEADYLDPSKNSAFTPAIDAGKGLAKGAMSALGTLFSPLSGVNRAMVANPVQNATGIPAGITDAAMSLVEPAGAAKLAKMADLPGLMDTMSAAADMPEAQKAATATPVAQAAPSSGGYNVFNAAGQQATPDSTLASMVGAKPISEAPPEAAAAEITGSTTPPPATNNMKFPMTGGEVSQDPTLQRFEADALAGTKGQAAQQAMMGARAAKAQAANDSISQLGNFRPDGSPSDEIGSAVNVIRNNSAVGKAAVKTAYDAAKEVGGNVTVPAMDAATNLVPDMSQMMSAERFNATTTPKAYSMYEDLLKTIGGDGKAPLQAPVLLQDGEDWRRAASQMAANTTDPSEGLALRKMIGVYDNYMSGVGNRLQGGTADAVNAFKDAVATRAEYGQRFEGNDLVNNIVKSGNKSIAGGNGMSVDDLTKQFIGSGNLAGRSGMLDDANSLMRAAGDQAPLVQQHLQNALAQNLYDKTAGAKIAGTDVNGINLGALQTHLENLFVKQKEMATSVFGSQTVADAQNAIKQLDMINSRQPNVGNVSNSGYTALRGLADHTPVFSWLSKGLKAMQEANYGKDALKTAGGSIPSKFSGSVPKIAINR